MKYLYRLPDAHDLIIEKQINDKFLDKKFIGSYQKEEHTFEYPNDGPHKGQQMIVNRYNVTYLVFSD